MYLFVFAAAAGALYFTVSAIRQPRLGAIVTAVAWLAYTAYEYFIANGTLCDADCNIRVDLFLIWPLLGLISLFGVYRSGRWTGPAKTLAAVGLGVFVIVAALFLYMMFFESPAAEQARAERCAAQGQGGPDCPPAAPTPASTPATK